MKSMVKKISIVIPAYNEEKRISVTIKKILDYLDKKDSFEVIVVDDGSTDKTVEVVKSIKDKRVKIISYKKNKGKGHAVKTGMLAARNEVVLFSDADLSTPIEELDKFMKFVKQHDIIIGSRVIAGHKIIKKQSSFRVFLGKIFSKITKTLLNVKVQDTQCGFKLFKNCKEIFKKQTINGFAFDVEILFIASRRGLKILEVPVVWKNVKDSKVSITDPLKMFIDVLKIKINALRGIYK